MAEVSKARDVILVGPSSAGKSSIADILERHGFTVVRARAAIAEAGDHTLLERADLQAGGEDLERQRPGKWLADAAAARKRPVVVDAARTKPQLEATRRLLDGCLTVYLDADHAVRANRYVARADPADVSTQFEQLAASSIEVDVKLLRPACDLVIDTTSLSVGEVVDQVLWAAVRR